MKKTIGFILLALIFALLIGTSCYVFGWKMGIIIWGIGFAVALIIVIAIYLIEDGE